MKKSSTRRTHSEFSSHRSSGIDLKHKAMYGSPCTRSLLRCNFRSIISSNQHSIVTSFLQTFLTNPSQRVHQILIQIQRSLAPDSRKKQGSVHLHKKQSSIKFRCLLILSKRRCPHRCDVRKMWHFNNTFLSLLKHTGCKKRYRSLLSSPLRTSLCGNGEISVYLYVDVCAVWRRR